MLVPENVFNDTKKRGPDDLWPSSVASSASRTKSAESESVLHNAVMRARFLNRAENGQPCPTDRCGVAAAFGVKNMNQLSRHAIAAVVALGILASASCGRKETGEAPKAAEQQTSPAQPAGSPHVTVNLNDGSKVPGTIVASHDTDMVVAGDDGIERKIPLTQIKSVDYGTAAAGAKQRASAEAKPEPAKPRAAPEPQREIAPQPSPEPQQTAVAPPPPPAVTTRTYVLPVGSEVSVRTNERIDSATAAEGQTFDAQVTRNVTDANGDIVIPRGSDARIVIKSASKGGRFHGASDLVLDLQSVTINGRRHRIDTAEITQKGKPGVGANKRTAEYTGGGAALGAIIGAIAGGGKGAAIGAGAGAGAGALTQILTKGGSIKVPAESVLTFRLDRPLRVTASE